MHAHIPYEVENGWVETWTDISNKELRAAISAHAIKEHEIGALLVYTGWIGAKEITASVVESFRDQVTVHATYFDAFNAARPAGEDMCPDWLYDLLSDDAIIGHIERKFAIIHASQPRRQGPLLLVRRDWQ